MAVIDERIGRNGQPVYRVRVRIKGKPIESRTFTRKTEAKEWARSREETLKSEVNFGAAAHSKKPLAELIDQYVRLEVPKRKTDRRNVETRLQWWRDQIGHLALKDITPSLLAECRDRLLLEPHKRHKFSSKNARGESKSPNTVIGYMAALSHAFSIACREWGWLSVNPMANVTKPRKPRGRVRFLDEEERSRLLEACAKSDCRYLYTVVILALSTGARYSEIMNLRWRDVDLDRGVARLEQTKNQERRALPLAHVALTQMRRLRRKSKPKSTDFVFAREDGEAPMQIRKHWDTAIRAAAIEDFRFHDLRHSAASYLAMNGATLAEIAEVLGHKTLQMVKRYAHLSEQHTAGVVERMNKAIFDATVANDNEAGVKKRKSKG